MLPLNLRVNSTAALRAIPLLVCWRDTALSSAMPDKSSLTPQYRRAVHCHCLGSRLLGNWVETIAFATPGEREWEQGGLPMKYCGHCGHEWADSFEYCPNDATPLQATPPDPLLGKLLRSKYEILQRLGRGPHGMVYRAHHRIADQACVVKVLDSELTREESQLQQVKAGVRFALGLRSPHTVRLYDFDYAEEAGYFLVEELVEGDSLDSLLQKRPRLPARVCAALLRQIAESLSEAHGCGLGHGRLVPANVLLAGSFPDLIVKVSGYGLTGPADRPEADQRPQTSLDLVSLGALLFQMLTGEEAFTIAGGNGRAVRVGGELKAALQRAEAPHPLAELALGLLGVEVGRRFDSATEVASALSEPPGAAPGKPESAPTVPSAPLAPEPSAASSPAVEYEPLPPPEEPQLSLLRVGIFLGIVALVGLLGVWLWRGSSAPSSPTTAAPAASEVSEVSSLSFDYEIVQRPNEGDPVKHPHVVVRVGGLPLYIIRDKSPYASTVGRAQAAREALDQAAENLRANPKLRFALARREGNPTIVLEGAAGSGQLPIIAITRADVYAYNVRSHEKTTQAELGGWWLARTRDYMGLFVLGKAPRLTTRTEDGAALARLYEIARARSADVSQPASTALQPALSELDPKLKEVLETGVFQLSETHHE